MCVDNTYMRATTARFVDERRRDIKGYRRIIPGTSYRSTILLGTVEVLWCTVTREFGTSLEEGVYR